MSDDHLPTTFIRALSALLAAEPRVEGFWLEGEDEAIQWPPYRTLDLHFAVAEPHLEEVRQAVPGWFAGIDAISDPSQQEAPLKGYAGSARLSDGTALTYRVERTSQIAKVPRRAVNVLLDRTGGLLIPALSFET